MQINRVVANNFFSFQHFDLVLKDRGLLCIEGENTDAGGSNGSGKSSIFESIVWAFFGTTTRGIKAADVVRRDISGSKSGDCSVVVEVDVDGTTVLVGRHREHSKYGNKLVVSANGTDISMGSDKETLARLEDMLHIDYQSFVSAVLYPQGAAGFPSLGTAEQSNILEQVVSLKRFSDALDRTRARLVPLYQAATKFDNEISMLNAKFLLTQQNRAELQEKSAVWIRARMARVQELKKQLEVVQQTPVACNGALPNERAQLQQQLQAFDVAEIEKLNKTTNERISHVLFEKGQAAGTQKSLKAIIARASLSPVIDPKVDLAVSEALLATAQSKLTIYRQDLQRAKGKAQSLREEKIAHEANTHCKTCGQLLPNAAHETVLAGIEQQIKATASSITELEASIAKEDVSLSAAKQAVTDAKKFLEYNKQLEIRKTTEVQIEVAAKKEATCDVELGELRKQQESFAKDLESIQTINRRLVAIAKEIDNEEKSLQEHKRSLLQLAASLNEAENQEDPFAQLISKAADDIITYERALGIRRAVAKENMSQIRMLELMKLGFSNAGMKSLIFSTVTPYLSFHANDYLRALSGGTAGMLFSTQKTLNSGELRDKFDVQVFYAHGADKYDGLSGGERRRVDIASLFALGDLGASRSMAAIKLRLLDEPFDNLDSVGAEQVIELLRNKILPQAGTVIVVTHDDNLKAMIPDRILVRKRNGISSIVER